MLAQDVSFIADGGGKVAAARQPVQGRGLVAKLLIKLAANAPRLIQAAEHELRLNVTEVNGEPAMMFWVGDRLDTVFIFSLGDEQIRAIHAIRNPDKLVYIQRQLFACGAGGPVPAA
jgi:RNA polymerase sigma-70 factor (ECF subfamily)